MATDEDSPRFHQFNPTAEEAVTLFLPRLLAGETDKPIRRADVYDCEPWVLAQRFAPVGTAAATGDQFFFTTCKGKKGHFARAAGDGTWSVQTTKNVYSAGVKVGEVRKLSFKKDNAVTGWVMEEYRCLLPEAVVSNGEKMLCKIHLAQHGKKRAAPIAAAADPSSCKKIRVVAPLAFPGPEENPDKHGLEKFYKLHQFKPTEEEVVTHLLPRQLAGNTDKHIIHADVYASEPKELAERFAPVPRAESTGDRYFYTTSKRKKNGRCARAVGTGTWTIQTTKNVYSGGVKVGEVGHLSFTKGKVTKVSTGWVMEEYRCLLPEAVVADGEKVLCRIHLSPTPPDAAREESNAYKLHQERAKPQPSGPVTVTASASAHVQQWPIALTYPPCAKNLPMASPVPEPEEEYEDCPDWSTPDAPVALPEVPAAAEADDDRLLEQPQEADLPAEAEDNIEQFDDIDQLAEPLDLDSLLDPEILLDCDFEEEAGLQKRCDDYIDQLEEPPLDDFDEVAVLRKRSDYDALVLQWHNQNQFFPFAAVN